MVDRVGEEDEAEAQQGQRLDEREGRPGLGKRDEGRVLGGRSHTDGCVGNRSAEAGPRPDEQQGREAEQRDEPGGACRSS